MFVQRSVVSMVAVVLAGCAAPAYVSGKRVAPAAMEGVAHAEARVDAAKNVSLLTQSWRPEAGDVRGVVVLVHGLKDHGDRYAEFAKVLVEHHFAVYALDLRGHGDSSGDRVWVDEFDDYLGDVDLIVAQARAKEPGKKLFLFGHSMGGAISTLYSLERKPELGGLLLSGAALKIAAGGFLVGTTKFLSAIAPTAAVFELDDTKFSRDAKVVEAMKADPLVYDDKAPARTAASVIRGVDRIRERGAELTCPMLVMHGGADEVTPPDGSRELVAQAASTDKTLKIYDGLYHDLLHEPERAQVMADTVGWLEAHTQ